MPTSTNLTLLKSSKRCCNDRLIKEGVFSNRFVGIEVSDTDGRILEVNPHFRSLVGYDESELLVMTVGDLCHGEDQERELHQRLELVEGKIDHLTFRKRYQSKAGKTIWGDTSISVVRNDTGNVEALVATMIDATEYRREELLQKGQSRVLDLLYRDSTLTEVCTAIVRSIEEVEQGLLCSILELNETTGTLHKIAAPSLPDFYNDAIEGMKIGDGVGSCGTAAFFGRRVVVADILNHPYWAKAQRLVKKTNLRSCWSQPIFTNGGKVLGTFAIYYTEPREPGPFELELIRSAADLTALAISHKQALSALQKSNQLKNEFISTAAHELRTPISSIMGYAELLRQAQDFGFTQSEKGDEFLDVIVEKSEMLSRIIGDLLDISKIENGYSLSLKKKPTLIHKTLDNVIRHFEKGAPQLAFCLRKQEELPETVLIDEGRVVQVLENLLSNAVKYSPDNGSVILEAGVETNLLCISVIDRGTGMSEDQVARIFDKFYRANANDPTIQGLGLGMSVVKEIVEAHGGRIEIQSTLGIGTHVQFTIPL